MDRIRFKVTAGLLTAVLLGVIGCGDDADDSPTEAADTTTEQGDALDPAPDDTGEEASVDESADGAVRPWDGEACGLLTAADIEARFGQYGPVSEGHPQGIPQRCQWEIGSVLDDGGIVVLEVYLDSSLDEDARALAEAQPVDGLGDEAYFDAQNSHLLFRTGDVSARVTVGFTSHDPPLDLVRPLAERVLPQL